MPAFPKPKFIYNFNVSDEIDKLVQHKTLRGIPDKSDTKLLISSWNIANLGLQNRWEQHYQIISEIINWFDIIAIQEVNDNLKGLKEIEARLPSHYELVFSDKAGNNERFAFAYDSRKVNQLELVGEISVPPKDHKYIKLTDVQEKFTGFDRSPFLCSFQWRNSTLILINVHSYFGSENDKDLSRRALEAYAISRYADLRGKSKNAFSKNIIAMGDFNLPKVDKGDKIYKALLKRGLKLPKHSSKVYSNIKDDKQYDQIAFLPSIKSKIEANGIFDFDHVIFPDLWQESKSKFRSYLRYYISDHRPIWIQLDL